MQQSKHHLVVVHDFGSYAKGQKITASDEVEMILRMPQHTHVVKIANPDWTDAPADSAGASEH